MATVKTKPKSQAQKEKRQAAKDAEILSRAAAAVKAPKPAPKAKPSVAPAADSQQIAQLRREIDRLTAENAKLQVELAQKRTIIGRMNETAFKLIEEKNAIAKLNEDNLNFLKSYNGQWLFVQVED